jgi:DNA-binding transcriptional LysR family regulator
LSKQLREIELAVGHRVFRRHGRGVELTKHGDALRRAVQAAYKLVDATIGQIRTTHGRTPVKTLRVATLHGRSQSIVNELLTTAPGKRPEMNLTVMESSAADVCRLVETGIADVGFIENATEIPDTLELNRAATDRGDLSWYAHAGRSPHAAISADIPVTRVSCLSAIGSSSDIAAKSAIAETGDRTMDRNNCDAARTFLRLVAVTRKARRAA